MSESKHQGGSEEPEEPGEPKEPGEPEEPGTYTTVANGIQPRSRRSTPGPGTLEPGARVGRYQIVSVAGHGGMGVVYDAYDDELHRHVALKMLRPTHGGPEKVAARRARLLREAQALAQLTHPNIIAIYDAGTYSGQVFLAMEMVQGETLTRWVERTSPSWREIAEVFVAAGQGVAAAHAAGLVHRDIKPDNILIGSDGRPRVIDFGLARAADLHPSRAGITATGKVSDTDETLELGATQDAAGDEWPSQDSASSVLRLASQVTRIGAVVGTPGYMAPEQHASGVVDAFSDQFSFCATLYRTLYGKRPFAGRDSEQLRAAILAGEIREPSAKASRGTPRRLRKIIYRGLSASPTDRYPSMKQLLDELAYDPRATFRIVAVGLLIAVLAGVAIAAVLTSDTAPAISKCDELGAQLEDAWGDKHQEQVKSAFARSPHANASDTFARVSVSLDDYGGRWTQSRTDACRATHERGDQSAELLDLRVACLDRHKQSMRALTDALSLDLDARAIDAAARAAAELPAIEACSDTDSLREAVPLPQDATVQANVRQIYTELALASANYRLGRYLTAMKSLPVIVERAEATGHAPALARALYVLGSAQTEVGNTEDAIATLYRLVDSGSRAKDDDLVASAWISLILAIGDGQGRTKEALSLATPARAAVLRAGATPGLQSELLSAVGNVLWRDGKPKQARGKLEEALEIRRRLLPESAATARDMNNLANVLGELGEYDRAVALYKEAIRLKVHTLGPDHPDIATEHMNLGATLETVGQFDAAWEQLEKARLIWSKVMGPENANVGAVLVNQGVLLQDRDDDAAARVVYLKALAILERALGPDHHFVAVALTNLGDIHVHSREFDKAETYIARAMKIRSAQNDNGSSMIVGYQSRGDLLRAQGRCKKAIADYRQAIKLSRAMQGEKHPDIGVSLARIADCHLIEGKAGAAISNAERAIAILDDSEAGPIQRAEALLILARALSTEAASHARAIEQATRARDLLDARHSKSRLAGRITTWLAEHAKR